MTKYQVPQFIQTEVKIVGPFNLKQFLWIATGASLIFVLFMVTQGMFFFIGAVFMGSISLAFAFLKIDGLPLINYVAYMLSYTLNPKQYLYKNEQASELPIPDSQTKQS